MALKNRIYSEDAWKLSTRISPIVARSEAPLCHRLLSLGPAPGFRVRVRAQSPACIRQVGEIVVALETELAEAVVVRTV